MKTKTKWLIAIVGIVLLVVIGALALWNFSQGPEALCNDYCGYDPTAPYPTGGTCDYSVPEEHCDGTYWIPPNCCCYCIK